MAPYKSLVKITYLSILLSSVLIIRSAAAGEDHHSSNQVTKSSAGHKRTSRNAHKYRRQRFQSSGDNQTLANVTAVSSNQSSSVCSPQGYNNATGAQNPSSPNLYPTNASNQTYQQANGSYNLASQEGMGPDGNQSSQTPLPDADSLNSSSASTLRRLSLGNLTNSSVSSLTSQAGDLLAGLSNSAMKSNDLFLGFLPDDGSSGGVRTTMAQLNSALGKRSAVYGWYSQAYSGTPFDGSQLLAVIDDVKACNCVFQPAVMPIGGWQGLTASDNSQAVAIANVMKKFTDEGIPVWLRFAHEANYYQTDGTYQGTAADFKAGWAAVAAAVKQIAPAVKMFWTPNVASAEDYSSYEPDDLSTADFVGIDYYPKQLTGNDFLPTMKAFHDKYAVDGRHFAIGETGLGWAGSLDDKFKWLDEITTAKSSLPQFVAMAWFNFEKEYDYKIAGESNLDQKFTTFMAA